MQINYECIRALLLYFKENLRAKHNGLPKGIKIWKIDFTNELPSFSQEDIYNSLSLLVEEGYITVRGNKNIAPRRMIIEGITLKGHEFLAASKNDSVWKKTLESVKSKGGGITLEVLKQLQ